MLASDDLPDLIDFGNGNLTDKTLMKQYKDAGKLLKLNELLEKNAPEILEKTGRISRTRSQTKNGDFITCRAVISLQIPKFIPRPASVLTYVPSTLRKTAMTRYRKP